MSAKIKVVVRVRPLLANEKYMRCPRLVGDSSQ